MDEEREDEPQSPMAPDEAHVVGHFEPEAIGNGLDGSTTLEAGIAGGLTDAGGSRETERRDQDWVPYVEVDQPVQRVDESA